jgi:hypothetical protein
MKTFDGNIKKFDKRSILQTSSKAHISLSNYNNPTCSSPKCQIILGCYLTNGFSDITSDKLNRHLEK